MASRDTSSISQRSKSQVSATDELLLYPGKTSINGQGGVLGVPTRGKVSDAHLLPRPVSPSANSSSKQTGSDTGRLILSASSNAVPRNSQNNTAKASTTQAAAGETGGVQDRARTSSNYAGGRAASENEPALLSGAVALPSATAEPAPASGRPAGPATAPSPASVAGASASVSANANTSAANANDEASYYYSSLSDELDATNDDRDGEAARVGVAEPPMYFRRWGIERASSGDYIVSACSAALAGLSTSQAGAGVVPRDPALSEDYVVLGMRSGAVLLVNQAGQLVRELQAHRQAVSALALTVCDGDVYLASLCEDGGVSICTLSDGKLYAQHRLAGGSTGADRITTFDFAPTFSPVSGLVCWGTAAGVVSVHRRAFLFKSIDTVFAEPDSEIQLVRWLGDVIALANRRGVYFVHQPSKERLLSIPCPESTSRDRCHFAPFGRTPILCIGWGEVVLVVDTSRAQQAASATSLSVSFTWFLTEGFRICGLVPLAGTTPDKLESIALLAKPDGPSSGCLQVLVVGADGRSTQLACDVLLCRDSMTSGTSGRTSGAADGGAAAGPVDREPDHSYYRHDHAGLAWPGQDEQRVDGLSLVPLHALPVLQPHLAPTATIVHASTAGAVDATGSLASTGDGDVPVHLRSVHFLICSRSGLCRAAALTPDERIAWLIERELFSKALAVAHAFSASIAQHSIDTIGERALAHLVSLGDYAQAAKLCPLVLRHDKALWERWTASFLLAGHVDLLLPVLPLEAPRLDSTLYSAILEYCSRRDPPRLLALLQSWATHLYDVLSLANVLQRRLDRDPDREHNAVRQALAFVYSQTGQAQRALRILLDMRDESVFEFIVERGLAEDLDGERITALLDLNVDRALNLLVSSVDVIPVERVVGVLARAKNLRRYVLFLYFVGLLSVDPHLGDPHLELQVELYAEFYNDKVHPAVLDRFLAQERDYGSALVPCMAIVKRRNLARATVFFLFRVGRVDEALETIVFQLGDVNAAIELIDSLHDSDLWQALVRMARSVPIFLGELIGKLGGRMDPAVLVREIDPDLAVPRLSERLQGVLAERSMLEALRSDHANILKRDVITLLMRAVRVHRRGTAVRPDTACAKCGVFLIDSHGGSISHARELTLFFCGHAFHTACLPSSFASLKQYLWCVTCRDAHERHNAALARRREGVAGAAAAAAAATPRASERALHAFDDGDLPRGRSDSVVKRIPR